MIQARITLYFGVLDSYTLDGVHVRASASEVVVDVTLRGNGGLRIKVTRGDPGCQLLFKSKYFRGSRRDPSKMEPIITVI